MQSYTLLYRYRFWSVIVHIADLVLKRSCDTKFIKILACEQARWGALAAGREKEGELANFTSLEFEWLHRKSRCEMLIGGDDISNYVICPCRVLFTCFSMFTLALVSASRWLAEIRPLSQRGTTGELGVKLKFQRRSCIDPKLWFSHWQVISQVP